MISQVYSLDLRFFRLINRGINHPLLDQFFNLLADGRFWTPILVLLAILLFLRGGQRVKTWILFTAIGIAIGDPLICNPLKHLVDRPRPFQAVEGVRDVSPGPADHPWQPSISISGIPERDVAHGRSFPSAHVANATTAAFSASLIWGSALRWPWILVGLAALGRIYTGDHYPSDVLASIPLSIGYSWLLANGLNQLWVKIGPRFFPNSFARLPSLFPPQ